MVLQPEFESGLFALSERHVNHYIIGAKKKYSTKRCCFRDGVVSIVAHRHLSFMSTPYAVHDLLLIGRRNSPHYIDLISHIYSVMLGVVSYDY